jgi:restriction endonuclease Mrr
MKPVLELLKDNQIHRRIDMYKVLAMQFQLTEKELEEWLPSGKRYRSSKLSHLI